MSDKSSPSPLSQIVTQAIHTIQAKVGLDAFSLKKDARVPQLWIKYPNKDKPEVFPLLGDRYLLGRSSQSCDIVVRHPLVSQVHLSINRDNKKPQFFELQDEKSTNGVYWGKRRLTKLPLRHGDTIALGPPQIEDLVEIKYYNPPPWWVLLIRYSLYGTSGILGLLVLGMAMVWMKVPVNPLPTADTRPVVIYARDGKTPLRPLEANIHRELASLADFTPYLPQAVIASEDSRYYWHLGVDPYGIFRALVINWREGETKQGGSTVTQQLARSLFTEVGRKNTVGRKIREMMVALKLEAFYSKDEILKAYLNRVYLGIGNYGFEDTAQFYFNKSATNLTLSEAATLVAILPAPNNYNPVKNYDTAVTLRNRVISRMQGLGMISQAEADRARRSRIEVSPRAKATLAKTKAPYFYDYVFQELRFLLGQELAKEGNFIVETTLDLNTQPLVENALSNWVRTAGSQSRFSQGAMVTLNSKTGAILALTGGVDYQQSQFNRATQAQRQPGSTFKVFAYAAALEQGIAPTKRYSCAPLSWKGQKFRGCERSSGDVDMYRSLAQSENVVALRIAQAAGLNQLVEMAQRLGIRSPLSAVPGLVLGQSEVNLLEITGAYTTFANQGVWNRPHAITRIWDGTDCQDDRNYQSCRLIYDFRRDRDASKRVISKRIAKTMTQLLRGVVKTGTGSNAALRVLAAGKTGTTNRAVDLWFIGYVPNRQITTGIWLGNDDNSPTRGSSSQAAALWGKYMNQMLFERAQ